MSRALYNGIDIIYKPKSFMHTSQRTFIHKIFCDTMKRNLHQTQVREPALAQLMKKTQNTPDYLPIKAQTNQ